MSSAPSPGPEESYATAHLLRRVQAGHPVSSRAWTDLLQRCEARLRVLARFRMHPKLRGAMEIDDILQEVWIEAARHIHEFEDRGPGSLQRWLARILHYKLLRASRDAARVPFPEAALGNSTDTQRDLFLGLSRTQPGVSQDLRRNEAVETVQAALSELPPDLREAILLRVYEGWTGAEAAERLGLTESGFSKRFKRALERIASKLHRHGPEA